MNILANNIQIHYSIMGEGEPLILLHGNGEDSRIFNRLSLLLCKHYRVYAIDSRNHGESQKTNDYSYATMAEDIYSLIETLQLVQPIVVGFSDGAIIALTLKLAYPGTFSKMVWMGINLKPSDFKDEYLIELQNGYSQTKDPLLYLMLSEPNIEFDSLKHIKIPTLVVKAEDELFRDSLYSDIMSIMSHAELLEMKGHTHDSYVVEQDILYKDLMRFLE